MLIRTICYVAVIIIVLLLDSSRKVKSSLLYVFFNRTWSNLKRIGESSLIKFTVLIPVIGYLIIFNDGIVGHLEVSDRIISDTVSVSSELKPIISEDSKLRLFYLYFGFSFLGVGALIFKLFCPKLVLIYEYGVDYIETEYQCMTPMRVRSIAEDVQYLNMYPNHYKQINESIEKAIEADKDLDEATVKNLLAINYASNNISLSFLRGVTAYLFLTGFIVLSVPTIDMFLKVMNEFLYLFVK